MSHIMFAELGGKIVTTLAGAKKHETVLILGDTASNENMLEAVFTAAIHAECEASLLVFKERPHNNFEPPEYIAAAMKGADVIIDFATKYFIHTKAVNDARLSGARYLMTIPTGIEDYIRTGVIGIDYQEMVRQGKAIAELYESSEMCRITSDDGSDIQMKMGGRPAINRDGMALVPGEIDYFPGAQVSFAPIEETLNGVLVINGSISPPVDKVTQPVTVKFENGKVTDFKGGAEATQWKEWLLSLEDPNMFSIAHVSIGLNPNARLRGFIMEDERVKGCITFGIGSQMPDFKGNTGLAKTHCDAVSLMATVELDGRKIVEKGNIII